MNEPLDTAATATAAHVAPAAAALGDALFLGEI